MKRGLRWSDSEDSDTSSSSDDSGAEDESGSKSSEKKSSQVDSTKKKTKTVDFEALNRFGYKGGLSVLSVPPPKEPEKEDWTWSTGKETRAKEVEETYEDRQRTRAALADAEQLTHVQTRKEKKNLSFQQKEKRKRDLGQASRGKNYVEEEKRLLRESGVYSGFDS